MNKEKIVVFAWGPGTSGQLGFGSSDLNDHLLPKAIENFPLIGEELVEICGGAIHSAAISRSSIGEKKLYLWGGNESGQLGSGDFQERHVPTLANTIEAIDQALFVRCGWDFTMVLTCKFLLFNALRVIVSHRTSK